MENFWPVRFVHWLNDVIFPPNYRKGANNLFQLHTSKISPNNFDAYLLKLDPFKIKIIQDHQWKRIQWRDRHTLLIIRFRFDGSFDCIEKEVWYAYPFPLFKKTIIMEYFR